MVERYRADKAASEPSAPVKVNPFLERKEVTFLGTGCTLLDCVIGGGWPFGRVVNIVGDKSVGKTLLAEEAMATFQVNFPKAKKPKYRESEAAFDPSYFKALGGDPDKIDFGPDGPDTHWQTIESIIDDLKVALDTFDAEIAAKVKAYKEKNARKKLKPTQVAAYEAQALKDAQPGLYIIDSLDALSSETEMKRDIHEGSYNLEKQKLLGELFRKEIRRIKRAKICLIFISQIRDRIGANVRGKKYTRSGGKALDFYASIVLYLSNLGKVHEQIKLVKRTVAVRIKVMCEKNKITMPFRDCEFEIRFGYGIDDEWASLDYLKSVNRLNALGLDKFPSSLKDLDKDEIRRATVETWMDIEKAFTPPKGKYAA